MARSLNRVKEILIKVKHIQEEAEKKEKESAKYFTDRCNKISQREHERLNVIVDNRTGQLLSKPVCSYRYYSQLMQNYRNGIKALGFKHHAIKRHINTFLRKYSNTKEGLHKKLDPHLPIEKLRENIILLRTNTVTGSDFRRDLLRLRIEHHAYYMFEPKSAIKDWIRDDDQKQLNKKLHTQILVNPKWVKTLVCNLLTKNEPSTSDLCIGIALASGRRLTEIMKTASLKVVDDKTLLFSGQLKTKNRYLFKKISRYQIPSMIEAEIVVKALDKLRQKTQNNTLKYHNVFGKMVKSEVKDAGIKDYDHNRAVHKKYESTMNRAVRALFQNGQFSLKDCRALYTEVTYEDHLKKGEAPSAYRHRVLGHSLIETQLHYEAFRLNNSVQSIELIENNNHAKIADLQKSLGVYLEKADIAVVSYSRAPKMAVIHEWLKSEVMKGLQLEKMTPSYIRRHCLFEGKQLNFNTIKKYLNEFIQLAQY
ncbi:protelomerase family protein [Candidatus Williamhamiltonella defendens]|uniref:protelomerase family protein n=1 Tax=Candidatus Williamhamiltonella defendens TaxID=138072 RepID=UPI00130EE3F5|nr:protelomerase family protein [Candidatus Hamiltonella defensa]